jgi:hypothetical protein
MRALVFLFVVACGAPGNGAKATTSLQMSGSPADARVVVDDQIVGTLDMVKARGVAMPPGQHRVTVEREGYFPFDTIVEAKEGEKVLRLEAKLVPVPD